MKKIKSVFQRNYDGDRLARNEVVPGCEWVLAGEGVATQKIDGTCCMVSAGKLYKRFDAKKGKTPPENFIAAQEADEVTGHWPGWVPVDPDNKSDKWHWLAWEKAGKNLADGTYELCGEHIQGNPEKLAGAEVLIPHGAMVLENVPRTFEGLREYLKNNYMEGIVFHRDNGEMAKIKRTDFGFEWNGKFSKR